MKARFPAAGAAVAGIFLLGLASAPEASAQAQPDFRTTAYTGGGVLMNMPKLVPGAFAFHMSPRLGFGVYVQGYMTWSSPSDNANFEPEMTPTDAEGFQDHRFSDETAYRSIGAGLLRPIASNVAVYAGAGYTQATEYVEYYAFERREVNPYYWVEDEGNGNSGIHASGGFLIQFGERFLVRLGADHFPNGASMGAVVGLPR